MDSNKLLYFTKTDSTKFDVICFSLVTS